MAKRIRTDAEEVALRNRVAARNEETFAGAQGKADAKRGKADNRRAHRGLKHQYDDGVRQHNDEQAGKRR